MTRVDPGWIMIMVIVAAVALLWKPMISPAIQKIKRSMSNEEQVERGRVIFEDDNRWGVVGASCTTCHKGGVEPPKSKAAKRMLIQFHSLQDVHNHYRGGVMGDDDKFASSINKCITLESRLGSPSLTTTNVTMQDLLAYLKTL